MSCAPILTCQLAYIQTQAETALTDSVAVQRRTATVSDGAGGQKPTSGTGWTTVDTIDGLLQVSRRTPNERVLANQVLSPVPYDVYFAHGEDVRAQDRLTIDSRTFEVEGIAKIDTLAILDKAYVVELQK